MPRQIKSMAPGGGNLSENDEPRGLPWLASELQFEFYLGKLSEGDRLPSVRKLAQQLQISPTTALDLYKRLEAEGLVEGKERSGTFFKQAGVSGDRTARECAVLELLLATARRVALLGTSPREFAGLLLRLTGAEPRTDFRFGFLSYRESYEIFTKELYSRLQFEVPTDLLIPGPAAEPQVLEHLIRCRPLRCLITTFLHAAQAVRLARRFNLGLVLLRLDSSAASIFEPPETGKRYLVMRDADCARAMRAVICRTCVRRGRPCSEKACADPESILDGAPVSLSCERVRVASLGDEEALRDIENETNEIFASPLIAEQLRVRYGTTKTVVPLPTALSGQTIEDIYFEYLFGPPRSRAGEALSAENSMRAGRLSAATVASATSGKTRTWIQGSSGH